MSVFVDLKYVHLLSPRLERFHRKSQYLFNCRCPLCGDSQKTKSKMRGYFFRLKDNLLYKCHNCMVTVGVGVLLKQMDSRLYREYLLETYKDPQKKIIRQNPISPIIRSIRFDKVQIAPIVEAERCDYLPSTHPCRKYLERRCIPIDMWPRLYFTENYKKVIATLAPTEIDKVKEEARLLIPYYDTYGAMTAITGRSLEPKAVIRYITIRVVDSILKLIYGAERIDAEKPLYITEGPLDSLFLPNGVASGDANLLAVAEELNHNDMYLVYDNERRNKDIVASMKKAVRSGYRVMVWPTTMHGKDINEMVLSGHTPAQLVQLIQQHAATGLTAITKISFWKKV